MKNEDMLNAIGSIDDNMVQEASKNKSSSTRKKMIAIAACVAVVVAIGGGYMLNNDLFTPAPQITIKTPAAESPSGMRKLLNYNGSRYAFVENGASIILEDSNIGAQLGILTHDIVADPETNASKDLSATFALGGTIYEIKSYDPNFRIAVMLDGTTYLCERVGLTNGNSIDLMEYFETANLVDQTTSIEIYDHFGSNSLKKLGKKDIDVMLEGVSNATLAVLEQDDYEKIASAQGQGKSYLAFAELKDGTTFKFYLVPELGIAMVGDDRYQMTAEFQATCLALLSDIKQAPLPMH